MKIEFSSDELILALMSLVRATNPAMLRQGPEGVTLDLEPIEGKELISEDEQLLLKFQAAVASPMAQGPYPLELAAAESGRLVAALERLESLQPWPPDVLAISRNLRARLVVL